MRQSPREDGVDIVTGLARFRIVREYEQLLESVEMSPGVVMSSTLAALPLPEDYRPTLLASVSGKTLTTAIVRQGILCGYRCMDLPAQQAGVTAQMLLDEIYPFAAYYKDSWSEGIGSVRLAGLTEKIDEFRDPLEQELGCPVGTLLAGATSEGRVERELQVLAQHDLDAMVGWALNRGA